jgi:hypothetical protein
MTRSTWRDRDADSNGYADYMAKEIDEQPAAAARVLDELGGGIANGRLWANLGLMPFDRLQVIGCGTSLNAGLVIGNSVRRLGGLPVTRSVGSEASEEILEAHTLCLAISKSAGSVDITRLRRIGNRFVSAVPHRFRGRSPTRRLAIMRSLVTGAAGFIGSTLVDRLLGEGYQVSQRKNRLESTHG